MFSHLDVSDTRNNSEQNDFFQNAMTNYQHVLKMAGTSSSSAKNRYYDAIALTNCCINLRKFSREKRLESPSRTPYRATLVNNTRFVWTRDLDRPKTPSQFASP